MIYVDGLLSEDAPDPSKHTFIGTFRPQRLRGSGLIACPCGQILHSIGEELNHWQLGHFDIPQYKTIESKKESK